MAFFVAGVVGFFRGAAAGFLYGTVLVWATGFFADPTALGPAGLGPVVAFFVPMGWATIFVKWQFVFWGDLQCLCDCLDVLFRSVHGLRRIPPFLHYRATPYQVYPPVQLRPHDVQAQRQRRLSWIGHKARA